MNARQAGSAADRAEEEEEEDLDALLLRYERQAAADVAAVQQRQAGAAAVAGRKRQKVTAAEQREEAMSQPLGQDNKGFKLLAAMGYQQGQRIGKAGTGLSEPLPVLLKQDRLGLGAVSKKAAAREAQRQREKEAAVRMAEEAAAAEDGRQGQRVEFQARAAAAAAARRLEGQLRKAQQVCETLDTAAGVAVNVMWGQAPAAAAAAAAAGGATAADDLFEAAEPRHATDAGAAIKAGRQEAADFECLYRHQQAAGVAAAAGAAEGSRGGSKGGAEGAGVPYLGTAGAQQRAERGQQEKEEEEEEKEAAEALAWQQLGPEKQLAAVVERLRGRYCYCLYCGCRYDSTHDMEEHCPGPAEGDHE